MSAASAKGVVTVTLNPALDHSLECNGFRVNAVNRVSTHWRTPGGKGINVAAFLAEGAFPCGGGGPLTAVGFLGTENAAPFESLFEERGIRDACVRVPGETRVNLKVLDGTAHEVTDVNLPGVRIEPSQWAQLKAVLAEVAAGASYAVLAGSLPAGLGEGAYAELIPLLRTAGCRVALDSSGAAFRKGVEKSPDLIKPNRHELEELVGRPLPHREDVLAAARTLVREQHLGGVVVSLGEEGALAVTPDQAWFAVPPPVKVVSTVGAGDAMLAGFLCGVGAGEEVATCLRRGTAFAVGTLTRRGPVLPPRAELEALMARVVLHELGR